MKEIERKEPDQPENGNPSESAGADEEQEQNYLGIGMCLGMAIGAGLGQALFDNTALGMTLGMLLGLAIGSNVKKKN